MKLFTFAVFTSLFTLNVNAASFDCNKASTVIEKAICSDTELSKTDDEMSVVYAKVYAINPDIKSTQRDWLKNIKQCAGEANVVSCLKEAYRIRISGLNQLTDKNRGWIGFEIVDLVNTTTGPGVVVGKVSSNSPAELSGLKTGDVIYQINGNPITNAQANIGAILAAFAVPAGETLSLKIITKNQSASDIKIKAGVRPNSQNNVNDAKNTTPDNTDSAAQESSSSTSITTEDAPIATEQPLPEATTPVEPNVEQTNPVPEVAIPSEPLPEINAEPSSSFPMIGLLLGVVVIAAGIFWSKRNKKPQLAPAATLLPASQPVKNEAVATEDDLETIYSKGLFLYEKGESDKAFDLLHKAALKGHANSQYYLGKIFTETASDVDSPSFEKGFEWYKKAADQNHQQAKLEIDKYNQSKNVASLPEEPIQFAETAPIVPALKPNLGIKGQLSRSNKLNLTMAILQSDLETSDSSSSLTSNNLTFKLIISEGAQTLFATLVSYDAVANIISNTPNTPSETNEELFLIASQHPAASVREYVAGKDYLSKDVVDILSKDTSISVLRNLVRSSAFREYADLESIKNMISLDVEVAQTIASEADNFNQVSGGEIAAIVNDHGDPAVIASLEANYAGDFDEYMEVLITGIDGTEYYYWVETDDEDDSIEMALNKHKELERPAPVDNEDEGIYPMTYTPVILWNKDKAVVIRASSTEDNDVCAQAEIFICVKNNYEDNPVTSSLICSIFTIELDSNGESETYSLIYGDEGGGGQADQFFKYFDSGANIAVSDSSGGEWNSAWTYSNDDDSFSEEIENPEWTEQDSEALEKLHAIKWEYLESYEDDDGESFLIARLDGVEVLTEFEANDDGKWTAYNSEGFDDEKLSNYSNIWKLRVQW